MLNAVSMSSIIHQLDSLCLIVTLTMSEVDDP